MSENTTPRLVYKGDADAKGSYEQVETKAVADADGLDLALKDGWRLQRVPVAKAADDDTAAGKKKK